MHLTPDVCTSVRCNRHLKTFVANTPPNSPHLYQHKQLTFCTNPHTIEFTATTPRYKPNTSGKLPYPFHHATHINSVDRNDDICELTQQNNTPRSKLIHKHKNFFTTSHLINNKYKFTKESSNLLYKAHLHAQKGGGDQSISLIIHQNIGYLCTQQMSRRESGS